MLESPGELLKIMELWDLPSGPTIKTFVFQCRGMGSILVGELRSHKPWGAARNLKSKQNIMRLCLKYSRPKKKKARRGDGEDGRGNKNGRMVTTKAGCSWDPEVHFTILYNPVYVLSK